MTILISLFLKLSLLSLIAFGGINALLPSMLNLSVYQEHWIDLQTFANYFAIAQAAPGPNFMTISLIGWHAYGVFGALVATFSIIWPSSILMYFLQKFMGKLKSQKIKNMIQYAAAALAIGLVLSSAWQIANQINSGYITYLVSCITIVSTLFTRWHPLYLILLGGAIGSFGFI